MPSSKPKLRLKFHVATGRTGHRELREGQSRPAAPSGRIPRISRLMALAIRFEQLIQDGVVRDQAELAVLGRVSRARITQIMDLLLLAPDIQESLLLLPPVEKGDDPIHERQIRGVAAEPRWNCQQQLWNELRPN